MINILKEVSLEFIGAMIPVILVLLVFTIGKKIFKDA